MWFEALCVFASENRSLCVIKDCHSVRTCMVQKAFIYFSSSALLFFSFRTPLAQDKSRSVCLCVLKLWYIYSSVLARGVFFIPPTLLLCVRHQTITNPALSFIIIRDATVTNFTVIDRNIHQVQFSPQA